MQLWTLGNVIQSIPCALACIPQSFLRHQRTMKLSPEEFVLCHTRAHTHPTNAANRQQRRPECTILVRRSVKTKPRSNAAPGAVVHEETTEDSDSTVRPWVNPSVQHLMSAKTATGSLVRASQPPEVRHE